MTIIPKSQVPNIGRPDLFDAVLSIREELSAENRNILAGIVKYITSLEHVMDDHKLWNELPQDFDMDERERFVRNVENGEFPRLHCAECDWQWSLHQPDAPLLSRITSHEFVIPKEN